MSLNSLSLVSGSGTLMFGSSEYAAMSVLAKALMTLGTPAESRPACTLT